MPRRTRQVETRLIGEYLRETFPRETCLMAQPVGTVGEALMASEGYQRALGMSRPFRPEVDAIVVLPRYLLLIEAKVWNVVSGLAKLPLYRSLIPVTPELKRFLPREVIMRLVVGWSNSNLEIMARDAGVEVARYCPPWLQEVVDGMHHYWTAEYRQKREERLRTRELLGLE
jgi:hypothetical protein